MQDLSHLKLYFAATKEPKAFLEGKVDKAVYKGQVSEEEVENLQENLINYTARRYGSCARTTFIDRKLRFFLVHHFPLAVQPTDFIYNVDERIEYSELFKIVVWLGTENSIYQKSAKVVSLEQLRLLAKGIHTSKENKKQRTYPYYGSKWKKIRGGQRSTQKNVLVKDFYDIEDYQKEGYPVKKKARVSQRLNDNLDWDKPYNVYGADWKRRTKVKHQYEANKNKHQFVSKKVDKYAHLQEYMNDEVETDFTHSRRIGDEKSMGNLTYDRAI